MPNCAFPQHSPWDPRANPRTEECMSCTGQQGASSRSCDPLGVTSSDLCQLGFDSGSVRPWSLHLQSAPPCRSR